MSSVVQHSSPNPAPCQALAQPRDAALHPQGKSKSRAGVRDREQPAPWPSGSQHAWAMQPDPQLSCQCGLEPVQTASVSLLNLPCAVPSHPPAISLGMPEGGSLTWHHPHGLELSLALRRGLGCQSGALPALGKAGTLAGGSPTTRPALETLVTGTGRGRSASMAHFVLGLLAQPLQEGWAIPVRRT